MKNTHVGFFDDVLQTESGAVSLLSLKPDGFHSESELKMFSCCESSLIIISSSLDVKDVPGDVVQTSGSNTNYSKVSVCMQTDQICPLNLLHLDYF